MDAQNRLEALKRGHMRRRGARRLSEEYLEAIYELAMRQERIRPIDVSRALNVAPSTVNKVLNRLASKGYVTYHPYRELSLTPQGEREVLRLKRRHDALAKLLHIIGMEPIAAEIEAEKIEHNLSERSTEIIEALADVLYGDKELADLIRRRVSKRIEAGGAG